MPVKELEDGGREPLLTKLAILHNTAMSATTMLSMKRGMLTRL